MARYITITETRKKFYSSKMSRIDRLKAQFYDNIGKIRIFLMISLLILSYYFVNELTEYMINIGWIVK